MCKTMDVRDPCKFVTGGNIRGLTLFPHRAHVVDYEIKIDRDTCFCIYSVINDARCIAETV